MRRALPSRCVGNPHNDVPGAHGRCPRAPIVAVAGLVDLDTCGEPGCMEAVMMIAPVCADHEWAVTEFMSRTPAGDAAVIPIQGFWEMHDRIVTDFGFAHIVDAMHV